MFSRPIVFICLATAAVAVPPLQAAPLRAVYPGNEAVNKHPSSGARQVELPPMLEDNRPNQSGKVKYVMPQWDEKLARSVGKATKWWMIEGANGLVECGGPTLNPNACRPSTFGTHKALRIWLVKLDGTWTYCRKIADKQKCIGRGASGWLLHIAAPVGATPE